MKLDELAQVTRGITTTNKNLVPSEGSAYRVVQVRHLQGGVILPAKALKLAYVSAAANPRRFAVKAGDILVAMLGATPKVVAVKTTPSKYLADKALAIVRPSSVRARGRILKYLTSDAGQSELRSRRMGVTIPHMATAALKAIEIS